MSLSVRALQLANLVKCGGGGRYSDTQDDEFASFRELLQANTIASDSNILKDEYKRREENL